MLRLALAHPISRNMSGYWHWSSTVAMAFVDWNPLTGIGDAPTDFPVDACLRADHLSNTSNKIIPLSDTWLDRRRAQAIAGAQDVARVLGEMGVKVLVTGSLARGEFGPHSDIDFLVTACPRHLKYTIEGVVEDALHGLLFDVVVSRRNSSQEVSPFLNGSIDASKLG